MLTPGPMTDAGYPHTVNPIGLSSLATVNDFAHGILFLLPLAMLLSAASVVVRFRHAGPVERTQITWLAAAASTVVVIYALVLPMSGAADHNGTPPTWLQAAQAVALLSFGLIPAAVLVAVLRYRLYEIDVIIRRTVTYTVLAVVLGATYLAGIWLLGWMLRSLTGASGALAVTLSTLAVWAAFQPLRGRVQALVDRRFARERYDADHALAGLSAPAARPHRAGIDRARAARRWWTPPCSPTTPACGCGRSAAVRRADRAPARPSPPWPGRWPCWRCLRPPRRRCFRST